PEGISWATTGPTSSDYFQINKIAIELGFDGDEDFDVVPLDGEPEILTNILGGRFDVALVSPTNANEYSEELRALAVLSEERMDSLPDIPTLVESGVDVIGTRSRGLWIGNGVSQEVVKFWEKAMKEMIETEVWE